MKRLLLMAVIMVLSFVLAACASDTKNETEQPAEKPADGSWEMVVNEPAELPEEVQGAFEAATEKFTGGELKPVAYVATQLVSGNNFMILCEETPTTQDATPSYQMAVIYKDLEGKSELTSITEFKLAKYLRDGEQKDQKKQAQEQMAGGWAVPDQLSGSPISKDVEGIFREATEEYAGGELEPMALLATQVVAGTNYAFICKNTPAVQNPISSIQVVTVYKPLDSKAEISTVCPVDPADFNQ